MSDSILKPEEQIASLWSLGGLSIRELGRRMWGGIDQTDIFNRGYELAYNFLLAVFPMLLFFFGVIGLFAYEGANLRTDLLAYAQVALPPTAYQLLTRTLQEITHNAVAGKVTF